MGEVSVTVDSGRANGDVPAGWERVRVDEVGEVRLGRQRSSARQTGQQGARYLRAANITNAGLDLRDVLEMDFTAEERERYRLREGDVVLAEASGSAGQVGRAALWEGELEECCYQNTVIRFRPHALVPGYALLAFAHLRYSRQMANAARGVGIQHLGARRLSGLSIALPPWEEQGRIVGEANRRLEELDQAEAELSSAMDKVEQQRKEIVAAAATGGILPHRLKGPEGPVGREEGRRNTDSEEDDAEPSRDGWSLAKVGELGSIQLGVTRSPDRLRRGAGARKYLRSANITDGELDLGTVAEMYISAAEAARFDLRAGDVLIAEASGSPDQVGRSVVWREEIADCSYQNHIIRFRSDVIAPEYMHLVISHYRYSGMLAEVAKGVGIQHLGAGRFADLRIPVPPKLEQRAIVAEAERLLGLSRARGKAAEDSLERVRLMKQEVISAAVSGELVPQREGAETAAAMLERLGPPPKVSRGTRSRRVGQRRGSETQVKGREGATIQLVDALLKEDRAVAAEELFLLAGYDRNSPEQVELFYLELRKELESRLRAVGNSTENQLLEVIADAFE